MIRRTAWAALFIGATAAGYFYHVSPPIVFGCLAIAMILLGLLQYGRIGLAQLVAAGLLRYINWEKARQTAHHEKQHQRIQDLAMFGQAMPEVSDDMSLISAYANEKKGMHV